jgi:hypothetical protein
MQMSTADSSCLAALARRNDDGLLVGVGLFAALEALRHPKALCGVRGGNALPGRRWCAGGRDPSTAHNVHFVDVMLRSG